MSTRSPHNPGLRPGTAETAATGNVAASTPPGILVIAKQIDGVIISFDPAQPYEDTDTAVDANVCRKLVSPNLDNLSQMEGDLAKSWTRQIHFAGNEGYALLPRL